MMIRPLRAILFPLLAGAVLCASLAGCNYLGPIYVLASGPPKIPAAFERESERKHVILIDDLNNVMPRRALRDLIGRSAEEALLGEKVLDKTHLISSASARRAASGDTVDSRLAAVDVARLVGAEVIIYVTMTSWTLQAEPGLVSPAATAEVRILDAVSNERIWPEGERTHPLVVRVPSRTTAALGGSIAERSEYEEMLARRVGDSLAKLFYKHARERLSEQMRPS